MYNIKLNTIEKRRTILIILVTVCLIGGIYQGMLMPLLSILLEAKGITAAMNGLNAASLYIGILAAAPFMERMLYRFGFKPILITGTASLAVLLSLFPLMQSYPAWMALRFAVGILNHATFFVVLNWLGLIAPDNKRGRYLSYFGFAFGIGFSLGPLLAQSRQISTAFPFLFVSALCLFSTGLVLFLKTPAGRAFDRKAAGESLALRVKSVFKLAWFALLMPFGYGFMEGGMCSGLPVFLTRSGTAGADIALILTVFFTAGLVTQLPLGRMSDALGRKKTFIIILCIGLAGFTGNALASPGQFRVSLICFILSGGALGSIYSLGVTYVTDCIPKPLLPAGNMLCSASFGIGSLLGPFTGGIYIDRLPGTNFSWLFVIVFSFILFGIILGKPEKE